MIGDIREKKVRELGQMQEQDQHHQMFTYNISYVNKEHHACKFFF